MRSHRFSRSRLISAMIFGLILGAIILLVPSKSYAATPLPTPGSLICCDISGHLYPRPNPFTQAPPPMPTYQHIPHYQGTIAGWTFGGFYVTFGKSMTKKLDSKVQAGATAFTGTFCGLIPNSPLPVLAVKGGCAATVVVYYLAMRQTFEKAGRTGRCVKVRWAIPSPAPMSWKDVTCSLV